MYGEYVGWQGRFPADNVNWKVTPKYYGLPGMKKRTMLYNYDTAKNMPFVCVVEGVTDAHVVGDCCVAILGKSLSSYQSDLLVSTWIGKPIVLIFDPDAREEMRAAVQELRRIHSVVIEIVLPDGYDCGDYDRQTLWMIINAQAKNQGVILPSW